MADAVQSRRATNGRGHAPVPAFAAAGAVPYDDPLSKVLGLDAKTSGLAAWFGFTSAGTLLLVWLMGLALVLAWWRATHLTRPLDATEEIEILKDDPPPPPPPHPGRPRPRPPPPRQRRCSRRSRSPTSRWTSRGTPS
jgi:hypothetical protein